MELELLEIEWHEEDHPRDEKGRFTVGSTTEQLTKSNNRVSSAIHDELGPEIDDEQKEIILNPFSRTTDPNSSFGYTSVQNAWNDAIQKKPELAKTKNDLIQYESDVNGVIQKNFEQANSLYRGMRGSELEHIAKTGMVEPYQYSFVSFTMDKQAGMGYGRNASDVDGVTVEFDKDKIKNQVLWNGEPMVIQPVKYSVFQDHVGIGGEEIGGLYPISFADEMEIRSYQFRSEDTIRSITVHQNEFMSDDETKALVDKYTALFPKIKIDVLRNPRIKELVLQEDEEFESQHPRDEKGKFIAKGSDVSTVEDFATGLTSRGYNPADIDLEVSKANELLNNDAQITPDGKVVVYHHTTPANKKQIEKSGRMFGAEDGIFFSTKKGGQAKGFGKSVVKLEIPIEMMQIDDEFGDEAHLRIPTVGPGSSIDVTGYIAKKTGKKGKTSEPVGEPQQIAGPDEEIDHTVNVQGYDINIPVDKDEDDIVDEFFSKNKLYDEVVEDEISDTGSHPLETRLNNSLEEHLGIVDEPMGSCYLTANGNWVGGEGIYGYDEDHRPQMRKALRYAGIKLKNKEGGSETDTMTSGMKIAGAIRVGARGELNLDVVKPLTSAQVRAISDYAINKGLSSDDIIIDTNNIEGLDENRIKRQLGVEDFGEPEYETVQEGEYSYREIKEALIKGDIMNIIRREHELLSMGIPEDEVHRVLLSEFSEPNPQGSSEWGPSLDVGGGPVPEINFAIPDTGFPPTIDPPGYAGGRDVANLPSYKLDEPFYPLPRQSEPYPYDDQNNENYVATGSKQNSEPSIHGLHGHNVAKSIPEFRYPVEDDQMRELVIDRDKNTGRFVKDGTTKSDRITDKSLPQALEKAREEYLHGIPEEDHKTTVEMPYMIISEEPETIDENDEDDEDDDESPHMIVTQEIEPLWAKYHYGGPHEKDDICNKFQLKVFDLMDMVHRPIPPSEGLGYTTTHPNCQCYWEIIAHPSKTHVASPKAQKHLTNVKKHITRRAHSHELHTVFEDGTISQRTRGTNPMREAIIEIRSEFDWMNDEYLARVKQMQSPGRMFLIRASGEAITDHRSEGEPYRRWLTPDELHGMARTAIGKKMDINHKSTQLNNFQFNTNAQVLDSEFNKARNEIQMLINEQDPEILNAIDNQIITAVSINGGSPRTEAVMCPDCQTNNCECFLVPEGVVLGELDDIALTWVVTDPRGMYWRGMWIPPAIPGVKTTAIQPI